MLVEIVPLVVMTLVTGHIVVYTEEISVTVTSCGAEMLEAEPTGK